MNTVKKIDEIEKRIDELIEEQDGKINVCKLINIQKEIERLNGFRQGIIWSNKNVE